jgi:hypothetical protein
MVALSGGPLVLESAVLTGALVGLGISEYEAKRYEGKVKERGDGQQKLSSKKKALMTFLA